MTLAREDGPPLRQGWLLGVLVIILMAAGGAFAMHLVEADAVETQRRREDVQMISSKLSAIESQLVVIAAAATHTLCAGTPP